MSIVKSAHSSDPYHQMLIQNGFKPKYCVEVPHKGVVCDKITYARQREACEKVSCFAACLLGSLVGCFCYQCFLDATWDRTSDEELVEGYYFNEEATKLSTKEDIEFLGFDLQNPESIKNYLQTIEICESNGHYFYPYFHKSGNSSFLFVPEKDFTQSISFGCADDTMGQPFDSLDEIKNQALKVCAFYREVEKEKTEKARKIAISKSCDVDAVKKEMTRLTYDADGNVRVLTTSRSYQINDRPDGINLNISDLTRKTINEYSKLV